LKAQGFRWTRFEKSAVQEMKDDMVQDDETVEDGVWLYCNNSAVRRAARQLGQLYDEAMGKTGLKGTQFSLMTQIGGSDEPTVKALAGAMVMDLSALGHTLKPLIRDGLVELVPDQKDRRAKRVRLTAEGVLRQQEMMALWQQAQDRFDASFGRERAEELRRTLAFLSSPAFAESFRELKSKAP
jgi:DNA-binding MarR family transcriptional regulator